MNFSNLFTFLAQLVKNTPAMWEIPGLGRSSGEGKNYPPQYFWPGELHEPYSPWGHKELDRTERPPFSSWNSTVMLVLHFLFYSNELF